MGLFGKRVKRRTQLSKSGIGGVSLFGKSAKQREEEAEAERARLQDLEVYSGMRVEVTSDDGRIFLIARLHGLRGDRAQLQPLQEGSQLIKLEEPVPVSLRGYSSREGKAVFLEGTVRSGISGIWHAEHLALIKTSNDRAFYRVDVALDATFTLIGRYIPMEEPCTLVNISVGGACVSSKIRHEIGDKFLLFVKLLPDLEPSMMYCQILRIVTRKHDYFEYGCSFSRMTEIDQEKINQIIFAIQRKAK